MLSASVKFRTSAAVLVVEDNPVERALITRILTVAQLVVVGVDCGKAALEQVRQPSPI